jgi:hypothetical protein
VLTVPVRVPPPVLVTVKLWSAELPTVTEPKSTGPAGLTARAGAVSPVPVTVRLKLPPLLVKETVRLAEPAAVGLKRTDTVALASAPRLKEPPETTLKGLAVLTVPVRVPPPVLVTVKLWSVEPPTVTEPKSTEPAGLTARAGSGCTVPVPVPVPVTAGEAEPPLLAKETAPL